MAMLQAMSEIMESRSGRRPTWSIRYQGVKLATKSQVCRKPDMRPERCLSKPDGFVENGAAVVGDSVDSA